MSMIRTESGTLHSPFAVVHRFNRADAENLAIALKAIADPVRLLILALLAEHEELTVSALMPRLGLSQGAVSHHLKILGDTGLIDERQAGVHRLRSVNVDAVRALAKLIDPAGGRS